jgi:NAD(P)H-dependent FMN reductase
LKNALDTVYKEWNNKPMAFVSYGGIAGGIRSVQLLKPVVIALRMIPVLEAVYIPFFSSHIKEGRFESDEKLQKAAGTMLKELARWGELLKEVRLKNQTFISGS